MELRMYGLVPGNISDIQKGIQFGHAIVEYGLKFFNTEEYQEWARNWKTFIILNGGTSFHTWTNRYPNTYNGMTEVTTETRLYGENNTMKSTSYIGSMEKYASWLCENEVNIAEFYEPDLNDMLSGIVFIVDERVFNTKKYPDFKFKSIQEDPTKPKFEDDYEMTLWNEWVNEIIGGGKNLFLRYFLRNFKFA